ncbi:non-oxidative hydroxyarylic acid decarboxylases subunit D [Pseudonocardia spinosispora]|uniref:non-oxidative hydroxyarylic acid decarboxylases subunit D n=1 Tax=Pseudonocardia spinosispora TaxID=103441 RepID=UPI00048FA9A5|nr:non-oxidative hydroxyarylic acid decarboxylases subunit D [Pseudonocardia spinosispora]
MADQPECPRCEYTQVEHLADSPVPGTWRVWCCRRCFYAWRSTEPLVNTTADYYPAPFRLTEQTLSDAKNVPPLPPS